MPKADGFHAADATRLPPTPATLADVIAVSGAGLDWANNCHWTTIHGTMDLLAELRREAAG
jgi:hypothetical protein